MQTIQSVIDSLARAPEIIVPLVREVPESWRKRRPAPGKWSVHEHACHLAHVHSLFFERLERMLTEDKPSIAPYDPGRDDAKSLLNVDLAQALDRYERDRTRLVDRLRGLTPQQWKREAEHGEYSKYSVFIMFRHLALHDMLHGYRIEELLLKKEWAAEMAST